MLENILFIHGLGRWAVLGVVFAAFALSVWSKWQGAIHPQLVKACRISAIAFDIEALLGIVLFFISPIVEVALADKAAAMKNQELRFFLVEHGGAMFVALVLLHVGSLRAKRAASGKDITWLMVIFGLGLVCTVVGTPWFRPLIR